MTSINTRDLLLQVKDPTSIFQLSMIASKYKSTNTFNQNSVVDDGTNSAVPDNTQLIAKYYDSKRPGTSLLVRDFGWPIYAWGIGLKSATGDGPQVIVSGGAQVDQAGFELTAGQWVPEMVRDNYTAKAWDKDGKPTIYYTKQDASEDVWVGPGAIVPDHNLWSWDVIEGKVDWVMYNYRQVWETRAAEKLKINLLESPLTKTDAKVKRLLELGSIGRGDVKALSPLLDKLLFNPQWPFRTPGTASGTSSNIDTEFKSLYDNSMSEILTSVTSTKETYSIAWPPAIDCGVVQDVDFVDGKVVQEKPFKIVIVPSVKVDSKTTSVPFDTKFDVQINSPTTAYFKRQGYVNLDNYVGYSKYPQITHTLTKGSTDFKTTAGPSDKLPSNYDGVAKDDYWTIDFNLRSNVWMSAQMQMQLEPIHGAIVFKILKSTTVTGGVTGGTGSGGLVFPTDQLAALAAAEVPKGDPGDLANKYIGEPALPTPASLIKSYVTPAISKSVSTIQTALGGSVLALKASPLMALIAAGSLATAIAYVNNLKKPGKFDTKTGEYGPDVDVSTAEKAAIIAAMSSDPLPSSDNSVTEPIYRTFAKPYTSPDMTLGFVDPTGTHPLYVGESGVSRLAKNRKTESTIIAKKTAGRATDVTTSNGIVWSQPKIPYGAVYPYNHVKQTESGHIEEFDDTVGAERIHRYHKSGTYEEIDANGTRVCRIVGDDFEILERNGNVLIKGMCNITVLGDANIRMEQDANIEVIGNTRLKVGGDVRAAVNGSLYTDVVKNMYSKIGGEWVVNVKGAFSVSAKEFNFKSSGTFNVDGSATYLQSGKASVDTVKDQIKFPKDTIKAPHPKFTDLPVINLHTELVANFETPDEGSADAFIAKKTETKVEEPTLAESAQNTKETKAGKSPTGAIVVATDDLVPVASCSKFTKDFPLSPNFTLGMLTGSPCGGDVQDPVIIENLRKLALNCLEPIKKKYPNMKLTSGYRKVVPEGGSKTSDHLTGCAADFQLDKFGRAEMHAAIIEISGLLPAYSQLLLEYTTSSCWIHVAYVPAKGNKGTKFTMNNHKKVGADGSYVLIA